MIRVQMEKKDGKVSEEFYRVDKAVVENGWLKLYQAAPIHKEIRNQDGEIERDVEIRTRDLWINKDFIISIEDPYRPHSSEVDFQKLLQQTEEDDSR